MINVKRLLVVAASGASFLIGQETVPADPVNPVIFPAPLIEPGRALREHLSLTAAQVAALQEVQKSKRQAEQAVFDEMRQKQLTLDNLLRSGSNDYQQIGRLTVELRDLQKKLPVSGEPYRTRALAVLSQDQRTKLAPLSNALQLQWPANDAVMWNLLDRPPLPDDPIILPAVGAMPGTALTRQ
jgi:hypothetical protein